MTDALPTTGDRVRGALATARIKQVDAASALNISQSGLSRRISGELAWQDGEVEIIARLCRVPVDSLRQREDVAA